MTFCWQQPRVRQGDLQALAERIAFVLRRGDVIALRGDVGAGKTTLARALVRVLSGDPEAEVPSPTFGLVQRYDCPRFPVAHVDLFRLSGAGEAAELGFDELTGHGVLIVEWPERADELLPTDRLEIELGEDPAAGDDARRILLRGKGSWAGRLQRLAAIDAFLQATAWHGGRLLTIQGDASARRYGRIVRHADSVILMDAPRQPDGPPIRGGLPYSRIAHLAEDVRPYIAVSRLLREAGLSAPGIHAQRPEDGLLLVEDLGDCLFGRAIAAGADQAELWGAAVDVLVHLRMTAGGQAVPLEGGVTYRLPTYDRGALEIELELLLDWYWPALAGKPPPAAVRAEFLGLWEEALEQVLAMPSGLVLRDFHSPNLMWLPDRIGVQRVGILDFQDALEGHPAYDLVSLLQDARVDVPAGLAQDLFAHYTEQARRRDREFDGDGFALAYAALGAQRCTKVLGIFTRLSRRDGKHQYLAHVPRLWRYLERDLSHATLRPLQAWYETHFPPALRTPPAGG